MARQTPYLLNRNGRYFARLVIPKDLRPYLENKTELREALGPDWRVAQAKLHSAVASLKHKVILAARRAEQELGGPALAGRYPLAPDEIANRHYHERLALDEELRNGNGPWSSVGIDDLYVDNLRAGLAGKLSDEALQRLIGSSIERYRRLGNTTAAFGSNEWRAVARALCMSELEALARIVERDEGDFSGTPQSPVLKDAPRLEDDQPPVLLRNLFDRYIAELRANGKGEGAEKRWRPVVEDLIKFTRLTDARKLTKKHVVEWKDAKILTLSPRTVRDVYLTAVNAVLNWAVSNDLLEANPAKDVKLKVAPKRQTRPKGFTRQEALAILQFSLSYEAPKTANPHTQERPSTSAAKKWAPLICALTGARVSEITQLRKEDVREEDGIAYIRITPEAGKVKNRKYRDVPLHGQIIDKGFLDFVAAAPAGPLFYPPMTNERTADPAQTVSGRISNWLQKNNVVPEGVSPNHGWRHAFKTAGLEAGIDGRVLDAIQGHAARTAGENYGDVTLTAKAMALRQIPAFPL
ncbi:MAG TPA: tyrosine-type recombinase/integrase [Pseudorhizobium sp.]|jgi:integrase|nr:tyrosine-type recombinase/integrase [Pseudorhizobium sp.]